jgi:hypothetical protein
LLKGSAHEVGVVEGAVESVVLDVVECEVEGGVKGERTGGKDDDNNH